MNHQFFAIQIVYIFSSTRFLSNYRNPKITSKTKRWGERLLLQTSWSWLGTKTYPSGLDTKPRAEGGGGMILTDSNAMFMFYIVLMEGKILTLAFSVLVLTHTNMFMIGTSIVRNASNIVRSN